VFPAESDAELFKQIQELQLALIQASGVLPLLDGQAALDSELATIDKRLEDKGVNAPDAATRRELNRRRNELSRARNENRAAWMATPPAPDEAEALVEAGDRLLRRRLLDLGPLGALYSHRVDALQRRAAEEGRDARTTWRLLEDQALMAAELQEARPEPDPLAGLLPLPPQLVPSKEAAAVQAKLKAVQAKNKPAKGGGKQGGKKPADPRAKP
jgi:hypothetical protein